MWRYSLTIFILLLFVVQHIAQTPIDELAKTAQKLFDKKAYVDAVKTYDEAEGNIHYQKGRTFHRLGKYDESIEEFKKVTNLLPKNHIFAAKSYYNLGHIYNKNVKPVQYQKAIAAYIKAVAIMKEINDKKTGHTCKELAYLYERTGEYANSFKNYELAVQYLEKERPTNFSELSLSYHGLGNVYYELNKFDLALLMYQKSDSISNYVEENQYLKQRVYDGFGNALSGLQEYKKAIEYYQKSLEIFDNTEILEKTRVLNNIATCYMSMNEWNIADSLLNVILTDKLVLHRDTSEASKSQQGENLIKSLAINYYNIGDFYSKQKQFNKAFQHFQHAIQLVTDTTTKAELSVQYDIDKNNLPLNQAIKNSINKTSLITYLSDQAKFFKTYYDTTNNDKYLLQAYHNYLTVDTLVHILLDNLTEESQYIWIKKVRNIYEDAIGISHQLYQQTNDKSYLKSAFEFAESNKAVVMYRALQINQIKNNQRPKQLLQQIQSKLSRKDALVEYFMGEKQLYIFNITKQNVELHSVDKTRKLSEQLRQVQHFVSHYENETTATDYSNYIENAHTLYQTLLPNISNRNRLIIVPDDSLYYTSFATFLHTKPANKKDKFDLPYLIKKHQISYGFSSAILLHSFDKATKNQPLQLKIYAPNFDSRRNLSPLLARKSEVKKLKNTVNADLEEGFVALKHFYKTYRDSSTLYFATHASVSGDSSYLVFSDNILTTSDIYKNLDFHEQSIVLGACATGVGQLQKSEGTMSLTRAFMYKGSTNIISSLWDIDDEGTSRITNAYFQNLKDGKNSIEALHTAQLHYLNSPNRLHPKYWAAFTHTGIWEVPEKSFSYWWLGIFGLIVLLFLGWFWFKR